MRESRKVVKMKSLKSTGKGHQIMQVFYGLWFFSDWDERPLECFKQRKDMIWLTFSSTHSTCYIKVSVVGQRWKQGNQLYYVIIQAKKKVIVACTKIVAEQMARSCGFWIYLEGRIDIICLRIGYRVSERTKKEEWKDDAQYF